jgi:hypothetical protein
MIPVDVIRCYEHAIIFLGMRFEYNEISFRFNKDMHSVAPCFSEPPYQRLFADPVSAFGTIAVVFDRFSRIPDAFAASQVGDPFPGSLVFDAGDVEKPGPFAVGLLLLPTYADAHPLVLRVRVDEIPSEYLINSVLVRGKALKRILAFKIGHPMR